MAARDRPPFRADHVGSLLRPPELLRAREEFAQGTIDAEASSYVDLDQLCLSPQCGFSSTVEGNALTSEQQAAKLRLVVEVAEEAWG
jgi:methionine synthase II (cobalamin-independent)